MPGLGLRRSYSLIAPFYDAVVGAATHGARARSLAWLDPHPPMTVLLAGVGTGLDLPFLPPQHRYVGLDLTPAMLRRCRPRRRGRHFAPVQGNAMALPFADACFDAVVLHLILAVVPDPAACLQEAARVVRPGGTLLIFDKFLKPDQKASLRRFLSPLAGRIATRLDVELEPLLAQTSGIERVHDQPALAAGWFRLVQLRRCINPVA